MRNRGAAWYVLKHECSIFDLLHLRANAPLTALPFPQEKLWKEPELAIECDGKTTLIKIVLPDVDSMEVDLDEEKEIVYIKA